MSLNTINRYMKTFTELKNTEKKQSQDELFRSSKIKSKSKISTALNSPEQNQESQKVENLDINDKNIFIDTNSSKSISTESNILKNSLFTAIENTQQLDESKFMYKIANLLRDLLHYCKIIIDWKSERKNNKEEDAISLTKQLVKQLSNKNIEEIKLKDKKCQVSFPITNGKIIVDKFEIDINELKLALIKGLIDIISNQEQKIFDIHTTDKIISFIIDNIAYIDPQYQAKFEKSYFNCDISSLREIKEITESEAQSLIKADIERSFTYIIDKIKYTQYDDLEELINKLKQINLLQIIGNSQGLLVNSFFQHLSTRTKDFGKYGNDKCKCKYTINIDTTNSEIPKIHIESDSSLYIARITYDEKNTVKIYAYIKETTEIIPIKTGDTTTYKLKQTSLDNISYEYNGFPYELKEELQKEVEKFAENYRNYMIDS